jgi:hypothetical protein
MFLLHIVFWGLKFIGTFDSKAPKIQAFYLT